MKEKIRSIAQKVYGADDVAFVGGSAKTLKDIETMGYGHLPICVAKTQYSFSDDPSRLGAPEHFEMNIRQVRLSAGAGFIVVLTGDVMTMPGLPKVPAANRMDIDENGVITGLF